MTNTSKKFSKKLNSRFAKKQNEMMRQPAIMGDGNGNLLVTGFENFVYITVGDKSMPVFNNRVPAQIGVKVWVGYAPEEPTLFQVLSTRSESPAGVETGFVGYAPAKRYEWHALNGGQDPLYVHLRAVTPLRLGVSSTANAATLYADLYRGFVYIGTAYKAVARQDIDLYSHIPSTAGKAAFVLITIDNTGAVVQTKGSEVDIAALAITDIPAIPTGTVFTCGAIRVYNGQTSIQDGRTNTDFVDLRFSRDGLADALSDNNYYGRRNGIWTNLKTYFDTLFVALTGNQSIDGVKTFTSDPIVPDEAYDATAWNASLEPPTKNAVRDKIESMSAGGGHVIQDEGTPLTARANLNFVGAGVTATDDAGNNATVVTIPAGGITGSGTNGNITKWTGAGTVGDATNTDAEVASAVSLKHTQGTDTALGALSTKNPPIDADKVIYRDSVSTDALVTSTWTQVKAFLKTYFDTIYAAISHGSHIPVAGITTQILQWASEATAKWVTVSGDASIADGGALAVNKTRLNVRNETGSTIVSTRAVYISGFNNFPLISLVDNTDETKHNLIGVTIAPIANSADGYIATTGQFDAETNSWNVGTELYMSTSGNLTSTEPTAGTVRHVGIVTVKANYPTGKILMYTQPEEYYTAMTAGKDYIIRMGDSAGANKVSFKDYANVEQASLNSDGALLAVSVNGINQTDGTELASFANGGTGTHTASDAHIASTANPHSVTAAQAAAIPNDGWIAITATGTSGTLDAPSFEISFNADMTGLIGLGHKIKITQTTTKYFIVTKVGAYSGGATVITCYGGTDYTLVATATTAITNPFYSTVKAPFGFPLTQSKWTVEVTDSTTRSQATPTGGTWYNINNTSISVPIGVWNHITSVLATTDKAAAGNLDVYCTLSTANNSASDASSTRKIAVRATSVYLESSLILASTISVTSKTTYYLNTKTDANTVANIYNNNTAQNLSIKLICAYL
jgi:hypothetical protein